MAFVQERKSKGIAYLYLDKSIRIGKRVLKVSKYLGRKDEISKDKIEAETKKFTLDLHPEILKIIEKKLKKHKHEYPLSVEELKKIEEMNLKYKKIKNFLHKKDWEDIKKRFVANVVFESNALEGNSLTLRNFSEIIFENKIIGTADLREVYDAKNSYKAFSKLFSGKKELSEAFILGLHKEIMKNIDDRTGYKKVPNIILGRKIELTAPKDAEKEVKALLKWYKEYKNKIHPLELAFKFHHKFERIHPFADGNGRVGRLLLNYILIKQEYYPIIIRKTHRNAYLKALSAADVNKYVPLMRFALEKAKDTYRKFFEIYYIHI